MGFRINKIIIMQDNRHQNTKNTAKKVATYN